MLAVDKWEPNFETRLFVERFFENILGHRIRFRRRK